MRFLGFNTIRATVFTLVALLVGSQAWGAVTKTKKQATSSRTVTSSSGKKAVKKSPAKKSSAKGKKK